MGLPLLDQPEPWSPHPKAAPHCDRDGDTLTIGANGTRTCTGGWQVRYTGIEPGRRYRISSEVTCRDVPVPRDQVRCSVHWWAPDPAATVAGRGVNDDLLPLANGSELIRFSRELTAPSDASCLTLRLTLRWTASGETTWSLPEVEQVEPVAPRPPVRVAVVTGQMHQRSGIKTIADNVEFYASRCEAACRAGAKLLVIPEVAVQWGLPGHAIDLAVPVPGPETDAFAAISGKYGARICVGIYERDDDAVYNAAVLIGPSGEVDGRYHKVHLASDGEDVSGILAGDSFPVFNTEVGRLGCNICMDSSAAESSRMVGLNGADFLLLPIMGDHRASRWTPGPPVFCEHRWLAIQRTRAMDAQVTMVIARNVGTASCIIDRKGEVLAWNDGDVDHIVADVALDDGYRMWTGNCFRGINWLQRRPSVYAAFVDPANFGPLRP